MANMEKVMVAVAVAAAVEEEGVNEFSWASPFFFFFFASLGLSSSTLMLLAICLAVFVLMIIILPVVLTLPETYSCYPSDNSYFVKTIPNMSFTTVDPPFTCLADGAVSAAFNGNYFLKLKGGPTGDIETLRYYFFNELMTSTNATNPGVTIQGVYRPNTDPDAQTGSLLMGNPWPIWLHSDKNATTLDPILPAGTVELGVVWDNRTCKDNITLVGKFAWTSVADVMEFIFSPNSTLRKTPMQECTRFSVTFPQLELTQHVVPELFAIQPNGPHPHPVALPSTRVVPGKPLCQHSSFGELVLFPRPRVVRVDPPCNFCFNFISIFIF
jgi:hypothetical protein